MKHKIYKYIQEHFPQKANSVDKLLISTFVKKNKLCVRKNTFLKEYIIDDKKKNEIKRLDEFGRLIDEYFPSFKFEQLIEAFEFVISPSDRIVTGAVYTPLFIREYIINNVLKKDIKKEAYALADIACGCGGFLYTAAKYIKQETNLAYSEIFKKYIFGLDIKKYSINRTKLLLSLLAISEGEDKTNFQFNLFSGDALNFKWEKYIPDFKGFDIIVGNPPYVCSRKIEASTRKHLIKYDVCSSGHPDLYIPFFQIGLDSLKENGKLGYITMNSFFKSLNGRSLRKYFQEKKFSFQIIDFDTLQVFDQKAYTCICLIGKEISETLEYIRLSSNTELKTAHANFKAIPYLSLKSFSGWNLNNPDIINKIESIGVPFSEKFRTRNGIATLKNEVYIFKPVKEDRDYYYLQNGSLFQIEKSICKEIVNPNYLTNQTDISHISEKLIFPYDFQNDQTVIFTEEKLSEEFPMAYQYLKAKRSLLKKRDKGQGEYERWFAFGRTQSLERMKHKLFFPHITPRLPNYVINNNEELFFYNGIAVIGDYENDVLLAKKIMSTRLFWFYIKNSSKPYNAGYYSLSKNYIRNFGIYPFTVDDVNYILSENNMEALNDFFESKYEVSAADLI